MQRQVLHAADVPRNERELLASLRKPAVERLQAPMDGIWLRTCYRAGSDGTFSALLQSANVNELSQSLVLNDASLYDFGHDGWQRIFARMPQLVESRSTAQNYKEKVAAGYCGVARSRG